MCPSHIEKDMQRSHSEPEMERRKTTTCFLSPKTVLPQGTEKEPQEEKGTMCGAAKQDFLSHRSSLWTNRGSALRTLLRQVPAWFLLSAVFLHTHSPFSFPRLRFPTCTP